MVGDGRGGYDRGERWERRGGGEKGWGDLWGLGYGMIGIVRWGGVE